MPQTRPVQAIQDNVSRARTRTSAPDSAARSSALKQAGSVAHSALQNVVDAVRRVDRTHARVLERERSQRERERDRRGGGGYQREPQLPRQSALDLLAPRGALTFSLLVRRGGPDHAWNKCEWWPRALSAWLRHTTARQQRAYSSAHTVAGACGVRALRRTRSLRSGGSRHTRGRRRRARCARRGQGRTWTRRRRAQTCSSLRTSARTWRRPLLDIDPRTRGLNRSTSRPSSWSSRLRRAGRRVGGRGSLGARMEKKHLTYSKRTIRQFGGVDPTIRPLEKVRVPLGPRRAL